jgi:hypothetical protein
MGAEMNAAKIPLALQYLCRNQENRLRNQEKDATGALP